MSLSLLLAAVVVLLGAGLVARPRLARAQTVSEKLRAPAAGEDHGAPRRNLDPGLEIIDKIVARRFEDRRDVVTDRLLDEFDGAAALLEQIDRRGARCLFRGEGWTQIEVPVSPESVEQEAEAVEPGEGEGEEKAVRKVHLRFLKLDRVWRLDRVRLLPQEASS